MLPPLSQLKIVKIFLKPANILYRHPKNYKIIRKKFKYETKENNPGGEGPMRFLVLIM